MIVCLCHGINEKKIKEMIDSGRCGSLKKLQKNCKAGSDCGQCVFELKSLLNQEDPEDSIDKTA